MQHSPLRIYYTSLGNSITKFLPPPFSLFIFLWILRVIQAEGIWELNTVCESASRDLGEQVLPIPSVSLPLGRTPPVSFCLWLNWISPADWTHQTAPVPHHAADRTQVMEEAGRTPALWETLGKWISWPLLTVRNFFVFQENDAHCLLNRI